MPRKPTKREQDAYNKFAEQVTNTINSCMEAQGVDIMYADDVRTAIHVAALSMSDSEIELLVNMMPINYKRAMAELRMFDVVKESCFSEGPRDD